MFKRKQDSIYPSETNSTGHEIRKKIWYLIYPQLCLYMWWRGREEVHVFFFFPNVNSNWQNMDKMKS